MKERLNVLMISIPYPGSLPPVSNECYPSEFQKRRRETPIPKWWCHLFLMGSSTTYPAVAVVAVADPIREVEDSVLRMWK